MAKTNAGITGGFSGSINQVTGYRRNSKNIITGKNPYSSININPQLLSNANKLEWIMQTWNVIHFGIARCLSLFTVERDFTANELWSWNNHLSVPADRNQIIGWRFNIQNNYYQPDYISSVNVATSTANNSFLKIHRTSKLENMERLQRIRYYSNNNQLQDLAFNNPPNSSGDGVIWSTRPSGFYYLAAMALTSIDEVKHTRMIVSGYLKP